MGNIQTRPSGADAVVMSSIALHPPTGLEQSSLNPLPQLLQTPSGLALLELQGAINLPSPDPGEDVDDDDQDGAGAAVIPIGRVDFPDYRPDALDPSSTSWMKRVYLYVGQHQRLAGEVKKLPKPVAVVRRRGGGTAEDADAPAEELEVVEIVKYKLVFSQRPEPVNTAS